MTDSQYLNPGKVLSLRIDGVFGESLVLEMDGFDVCISAGPNKAMNSSNIRSPHFIASSIQSLASSIFSEASFNFPESIIEGIAPGLTEQSKAHWDETVHFWIGIRNELVSHGVQARLIFVTIHRQGCHLEKRRRWDLQCGRCYVLQTTL